MKFDLKFHPEAEIEYNDAFFWYGLESERLGRRFQKAIQSTIDKIIVNPDVFSVREHDFREAKVSHFPFLMVYYVYRDKRLIFISSIFHTSRNPDEKYRTIDF